MTTDPMEILRKAVEADMAIAAIAPGDVDGFYEAYEAYTKQEVAHIAVDFSAILAVWEADRALLDRAESFIEKAHHQDKCNNRNFRACTCGKSELGYQFSERKAANNGCDTQA